MANVVTYIIQALDQFSGTYNKMNSAIEKSERNITSLNSKIQKMGDTSKALALKVSAPIAAFATFGIKEFLNEKKALDSLRQTLDKLGASAPLTFDQISEAANKIELKSIYQADDVMSKVTGKLIRLGTIAPQHLLAATETITDFAAKTGMELDTATSVFAKAMQNPATGTRFFEQQLGAFDPKMKKFLKSLVESGKTAEAQGILLEIAGRKVKGAAELAKQSQPFTVMSESIKRVATEFGRSLFPSFSKFVGFLEQLSIKFSKLSPKTMDFIVITALIAAALPIVGLALAATAVAVLGLASAFKVLFLASPIGWIAVLAGGIIYAYQQFDVFAAKIDRLIEKFKEWKKIATDVKNSVHGFFGVGPNANNWGTRGTERHNATTEKIMGGVSLSGIDKPLNNVFQNQDTNSTITINMNDPNNNIKSAELKSDGPTKMNVGKNMAGTPFSAGAY